MQCDRCGSTNVSSKELRSKKSGRMYTIYECNNGCKNGKYLYSFFPPKDTQYNSEQNSREHQTVDLSEVIKLQKECIQMIVNLSNKLGGKIEMSSSDLQPDEKLPF